MFPPAQLQNEERTQNAQSETQRVPTRDETVWLFHYTNISLCRLITNIRGAFYQSKLYPWAVSDVNIMLDFASGFERQLLG